MIQLLLQFKAILARSTRRLQVRLSTNFRKIESTHICNQALNRNVIQAKWLQNCQSCACATQRKLLQVKISLITA